MTIARIGAASHELRRQTVLEVLDHVDGGRVDALAGGELERDQVAEHHRPEQPLGARLAHGLDADDGVGPIGDQLGGELDPLALARVLVLVLEEDGAEGPLRPAGPADDLVVVHLGERVIEGGELGVLVHLALPAIGDRRRQPAAVEQRHGAVELLGDLGGLGEQRVRLGLEMRGRAVDLGPDPGADAGERRHLGGDRERVADGGARLQARRHPDHRDPVATGVLADRPAGRRDDALGADGLGGRVAAEGLLGLARVAGAEDRAVGRRPGRAPRTRGPRRAACRAASRAPRRRGRRRSPSRPSRRSRGRSSRTARCPRTTRARGRPSGSREATGPRRAGRPNQRRRSARPDRDVLMLSPWVGRGRRARARHPR